MLVMRAFGSILNTHIFGCAPKVEIAYPRDAGWSTPAVIGSGYPVLAYEGQDVLIVAATFGVYVSTDGGTSFAAIPGGDTTAEQIRGTSGAANGRRLALAQSYSYGVTTPNTVAVLVSDDEGRTWPRRIVLERSNSYPGDPLIASDGDRIAVAWQNGSAIRLMTSPDFGASWSLPATLAPPDGGAGQLGGLAVNGSDVALAISGPGVSICTAH